MKDLGPRKNMNGRKNEEVEMQKKNLNSFAVVEADTAIDAVIGSLGKETFFILKMMKIEIIPLR